MGRADADGAWGNHPMAAMLDGNVAALVELREVCRRDLAQAGEKPSPREATLIRAAESLRPHAELSNRLRQQRDVAGEFARFKESMLEVLREVAPAVARAVWERLGDAEADEETRPAGCRRSQEQQGDEGVK